jgi:hypothetical protein
MVMIPADFGIHPPQSGVLAPGTTSLWAGSDFKRRYARRVRGNLPVSHTDETNRVEHPVRLSQQVYGFVDMQKIE